MEMLTRQETEKLSLALIRAQGDASEEELLRLHEWTAEARMDGALLTLVLRGELLPDLRANDNETTFLRVGSGEMLTVAGKTHGR